jgi:hypothetical protein
MTTNTGGPAFPIVIDIGQGVEWHKGMTLRDYFAAKVMQSGMVNATGLPNVSDESLQVFCGQCYRVADAMLKAREA